MARSFIYSIYDNKAEYWCPPFTALTDAEAQRHFMDTANTPGNRIHDHPNDFCLYKLAEWVDDLGEIQPLTAAQNLGLAAAFKKEDSQMKMFENGK